MRFERDGISLWFNTPDAPAPEGDVPDGAELSVTIGVAPADPSNRVDVCYRVDGGDVRTLSANWYWTDQTRKVQYFRATLPMLIRGGTIDYCATCRCAGRQVAGPDEMEFVRVHSPANGDPVGASGAVRPGPFDRSTEVTRLRANLTKPAARSRSQLRDRSSEQPDAFNEFMQLVTAVASNTAVGIMMKAVSAVMGYYTNQQTARALSGIASSLDEIKRMIANLREVIREEIAWNEINQFESRIKLAATHYTNESWEDAHRYASETAFGLQADNVQLAGCSYFLTAAGIDLDALKKLAAGNPARYSDDLTNFARAYRDHAMVMIPKVTAATGSRITITRELISLQDNVSEYVYRIDGTRYSFPYGWYQTRAAKDWLEAKRVQELDTLASPIVTLLKIAAESWRVLDEGGQPAYAPYFENCVMTCSEIFPPLTNMALIKDGHRIEFTSGGTVRMFSNVVAQAVPRGVYESIPSVGAIAPLSDVVVADGLPPAFTTRRGGTTPLYRIPFDAPDAIAENNSSRRTVSVDEYNSVPIFTSIYEYPYRRSRGL